MPFDELLCVIAAKTVRAEADLLGHARPAHVGGALTNARRQHADRHDVARDGQRVDDVACDDLRARRLLHVDLRRFARYGDRFFERADLQVSIDRDDDFRGHVDAVARDGAEAGQRKRQLVNARPQRLDAIASLVVGDRRSNLFDDCRAGGLDRDARKDAARFVADLTDNLGLRKCERRQQTAAQTDECTKQ